jgi:hypothetical protein
MGIVDPVSAQAADLRNDIVMFDDSDLSTSYVMK